METKFNFNSAICTSLKQSKRLLTLGLREETADVTIHHEYGVTTRFGVDYSWYVQTHKEQGYTEKFFESVFPAWSLSRLLCMLTSVIPLSEEFPTFDKHAFLQLYTAAVSYVYDDYDGEEIILVSFYGNGFFAAVVDAIEWLIKEGHFPKEYLD